MSIRATVRGTLGLSCALALGCAMLARPATAQETGRVTGQVTSAQNMRPLEGAQVSLEGTGMGGLANSEGRYLILNVPAGTYTVRVTMIGYGTARQQVTVAAGQVTTQDFTLNETALALDEIVVTGTAAAVRAKEVGNSLDAITSHELEDIPVRNTDDILAGRAPGVTIMTNSGQPGAGATVKIRGISSISGTKEPLIYVDGVRIYNEPTRAGWGARTASTPLQDIAADDIDRVEVVKGAAATTLYGTEAAAGVIQIFTKKGISGAPIWNAEISEGFNEQASFLANPSEDPTDLYTKCGNLNDLYSLNLQASTSDPTWGNKLYMQDPTCPSDGTWQRLGPIGRYDLSVRGGMGDVTYYVSGNYNDTKGTLPTSRSRDGGFRTNASFSPSDGLNISMNTAYTRRNTRWVPDGNNSNGFLLNVGRGAQNYLKGGKGDDCANVPADKICITNGYLFDTQLYTETDHFISGLTTTWNPIKGLSNRFSVGWDYLYIKNNTTRPFGSLRAPAGYFWDENTHHTKLSLDYAGSYQNDFMGGDLASTFSWGGQIFKDHHRWTEWDVEDFAGPVTPTIESGASVTYRSEDNVSQTSAGFFFQELLGYQDRLFLTAGLRVDGNSAFGSNFGLQAYPKVSGSWVLSDYDWFPSDKIESFKLRAALGESGKAPNPFASLRTWSGVGLEGSPGFTPGSPGNPDVGPERTKELEFGFDLSALNGRIGVEATHYKAKTTKALVNVDLPSSLGFLQNRTENIGALQNSGYEFQLTGALVRTDKIEWRARANLSFMKSKALDVDGDPTVESCIYVGLYSNICDGQQVPVLRATRIMNPDSVGNPRLVRDTTIGPTYPTNLIGLGTTISIGSSIQIDALIEHQGGHYLPDYTAYQNERRGSWHPCFAMQTIMVDAYKSGGASAVTSALNAAGVTAEDRARCAINSTVNAGYSYSSYYWIEPADFWRMRSVSLSYDVPKSVLNWGRSTTVTLAARNLFTITDYHGTDPEVQDFADATGNVVGGGEFGRRDYYQIPNPRTYLLSVRISW
ncbi:MAG: SusC/RagA family TonB-linked outer membrane protein [Gemmatimonadetes bacterium]|nr:SusC/RagA family TonB-linked outer membrane protein [Gemmatimonadota bacterium]